ncbi:MAG: type II secretion system F family protein [Candidatus Omnitrophica bacterium]|nr:type II secretion system F family protein [Candidatus Omnitrophota bacterium]
MKNYIYRLKDETGRSLYGFTEAEDKKELKRKLRGNKYYFVSAEEYDRKKIFKKRVNLDILLIFTRRLTSLIESGIPILSAIHILWWQSEDKTIQLVVGHMRDKLEQGKTISEALDEFSNIFPDIYRAMVRVAEKAGGLVKILRKLTLYLENQKRVHTKTKMAALYPTIVMTAAILVLICMFVYVVPIFQKVLVRLDVKLPALTLFVLKISAVIRSRYFILGIILLSIVVYFLLKMLRKRPRYSYYLDYYKLKIPYIGNILHSIILSRFIHSLSILLSAGLPIIESFTVAKTTTNNCRMDADIDELKDKLEQGNSLYDSFRGVKLFPVMLVEMIGAGEISGNLTKILESLAIHYDEEVDYNQSKMFTIVEPILILFVGGIVLITLLAIYLPVFSIWQGLIAV